MHLYNSNQTNRCQKRSLYWGRFCWGNIDFIYVWYDNNSMKVERAEGIREDDDPWTHFDDFDWYVRNKKGELVDYNKVRAALDALPEDPQLPEVITVANDMDLEIEDFDFVYYVMPKKKASEVIESVVDVSEPIIVEPEVVVYTPEEQEARESIEKEVIKQADEINGLVSEAGYYDSDSYDADVNRGIAKHQDTFAMRAEAKKKANELKAVIIAANRPDLLKLDAVDRAVRYAD